MNIQQSILIIENSPCVSKLGNDLRESIGKLLKTVKMAQIEEIKLSNLAESNALILEEKSPQDIIIDIACRYFEVERENIMKKGRKRVNVVVRQVAMTLIKENVYNLTLKKIGEKFRGVDHSTVVHAIKTVNNLCETDKKFKKQFEEISLIVKREVK